MPEHLRALIIILVFAVLAFGLAKRPVCAIGMAEEDFKRRRSVWFGITLAAFLAYNFWVYTVAAGLIAWWAQRAERNPIALYFSLLFAVPGFGAHVNGLGVVNHLFEINYFRLLALTILLPAWWRLRDDATSLRFGSTLPDKLLFGYLAMLFALQVSADSLTNSLRYAFYSFIDVFLPYYIASRTLRRIDEFREALACFVIAASLMAFVAVFEFSFHWLLYSALDDVLGAPWGYSGYLGRGDSLRALVTTGQPIALGYAMAVALGFFYFLWPSVPAKSRLPALLVLAAGIIVPVSRGPWVGAGIMALVLILTGEQGRRHLLRIIGYGALTLIGMLASPLGDKIIDHLPFIGTVDAENVTYRQQLFINSVEAIKSNPFLGASDFLYNPLMEEMRQGQGIIDLVNTFLAVALGSGLVGLALFSGVFLVVLSGVFRKAWALRKTSPDWHRLGVALAATQVGILVTIATVSPITIIPLVFWSVFGLGLAYIASDCGEILSVPASTASWP